MPNSEMDYICVLDRYAGFSRICGKFLCFCDCRGRGWHIYIYIHVHNHPEVIECGLERIYHGSVRARSLSTPGWLYTLVHVCIRNSCLV